jgi:hypothetical protein
MAHFIPSAGVRPKGSYNSTKGPQSVTGQTGLVVNLAGCYLFREEAGENYFLSPERIGSWLLVV